MARLIFVFGGLLIIFGIIAMFSVSIYESFSVTLRAIAAGRAFGDPSNYFYFQAHLTNIVVGIVAGVLLYFFPIRLLKNHTFIYILGALVMIFQLLVFIPGVGVEYNGAKGRVYIPGMPANMQPAEFFKVGYVIFMTSWLMRKAALIKSIEFFVPFAIVHILLFMAFLFIPDIGTMIVLAITGMIMAWYAGASGKRLLVIAGGGIVSGALVLLIISQFSSRFAYLEARLLYFSSIFLTQEQQIERDRGIGRQNRQALIAIGGGGFFGQGYGKGLQKFGYIPEAQSDFIFSAFSEEIGFLGNILLLSLYAGLSFYFLRSISYYKDTHMKLIGIGLISLIIIQMFVVIGVNTRIMPNTGLTLPFISHGGTAILVNIVELVLLYKIARSAERAKMGLPV